MCPKRLTLLSSSSSEPTVDPISSKSQKSSSKVASAGHELPPTLQPAITCSASASRTNPGSCSSAPDTTLPSETKQHSSSTYRGAPVDASMTVRQPVLAPPARVQPSTSSASLQSTGQKPSSANVQTRPPRPSLTAFPSSSDAPQARPTPAQPRPHSSPESRSSSRSTRMCWSLDANSSVDDKSRLALAEHINRYCRLRYTATLPQSMPEPAGRAQTAPGGSSRPRAAVDSSRQLDRDIRPLGEWPLGGRPLVPSSQRPLSAEGSHHKVGAAFGTPSSASLRPATAVGCASRGLRQSQSTPMLQRLPSTSSKRAPATMKLSGNAKAKSSSASCPPLSPVTQGFQVGPFQLASPAMLRSEISVARQESLNPISPINRMTNRSPIEGGVHHVMFTLAASKRSHSAF